MPGIQISPSNSLRQEALILGKPDARAFLRAEPIYADLKESTPDGPAVILFIQE